MRTLKSHPLVSVVIPTYNCATYLSAAIESVRDQTLDDYEIIIVDDGSSDGTKAIVQKLSGPIRYLYQDNAGLAVARNVGIRHARGELIAFLDADDIWHSKKLELQSCVIRDHPDIDVVFSDYQNFTETATYPPYLAEIDVTSTLMVETLNEHTFRIVDRELLQKIARYHLILPSTCMATARCFGRVGSFDPDLRIVQDTHLWLRMSRQCTFAFVNLPLTARRLREGSLITDGPRFIAEQIKMYQELRGWVPDLTRTEERAIHEMLDHYWYPRAYRQCRSGSKMFRRGYFVRALIKDCRASTAWLAAKALLPKYVVDTVSTLHWRWHRLFHKPSAQPRRIGDSL